MSPPSSRAICTWLVTIRSLLFYPPCEKRHFLILCSNAKSRRFSIRPIWQRPFLSDWCINGNNYCFKHPTPSPTFALHRPPLQISSSWTRFQLKRFFFLPLSLSLPYWKKKTSPSFIELLIIMVILSGGFRYQHEVCFGASGGEGNWVTVTVTEFLSFVSIL